MTTKISTAAGFILDDLDILPEGHHLEAASADQLLSAIRALEDGEYLGHMGYTDDDIRAIEEAHTALETALEKIA